MDKDQENVVSSSSEKTEQEEEKVEEPPQRQQGTNDEDATPDTTQGDGGETQPTPEAENPAAAPPAPAEPPRIRHDWYQTHADVVVNVMIKKLRREDVSVEFGERRLSVEIDLGEGGTRSLVLTLAHPIVKEKCSFKVLTTKVSICVEVSQKPFLLWKTL